MSRKALFAKRPKKLDLDDGSYIFVRSFTVAELMHVEDLREKGENESALYYAVRHCVVDESGERILDDTESLDELSLDAVNKIVHAVNKLSTGGSIEKLGKNSDATS